MKRIAIPMIGGVVTSTLMELIVYPAIFYVWRSRKLQHGTASQSEPEGKEVYA
jgi:Cu(I)/Ag(I) efflux system membrane protein CusA/SilA